MTPTVYKGDTVPLDFQLKWSDGTAQDITGAAVWVGVKSVRAPSGDPPLITRKNAAAGAGGSDTYVAITDAANGKFTAYLQVADTNTLTDGEEYVFGGVVQLASGTYTAGVAQTLS
jgi:type II secretory pathway pseudopilin PulG